MKILSFIRRWFDPTLCEASRPAYPSQPLRIPCTTLDDVPPDGELARLAVAGRHVVLQFPPASEADKPPLIARLRPLLPGHSVFDSGGGDGMTWVTVLKVIDESVVLENLPLFLVAIRDFGDTARSLCLRLAEARGVRPDDLLTARQDGRAGDWEHWFHGMGCRFTNAVTGQVVDVRLSFGGEFGVLDPYFLSHFIRTTPAHREAARLLGDDFHDACRVLDILLASGHLRTHEAACESLGGIVLSGPVLDAGGERK